MSLAVKPWDLNALREENTTNIKMSIQRIVMWMNSFFLDSGDQDTESRNSRIEVEYSEKIPDRLYIVSHWTKTEVIITELWDWLIELSIQDWNKIIINSILKTWLVSLSQSEIKRIIVIADIINACKQEFQRRVEERLWNAWFKTKKSSFFGQELYFKWSPSTDIISEKGLMALFKWKTIPSRLNILVSAIKACGFKLIRDEENIGESNERMAYMKYGYNEQPDWKFSIEALEKPLSDLLKELAEYLNKTCNTSVSSK